MMELMRRIFLLLCGSAGLLAAADLGTVHTVYLLPMSRGLDQFLANRLTNEHLFQVVTDPKLADAVFTDRIGNAFEEKLANLTAPPEPPQPQPAPADPTQPPPTTFLTDPVNKLSNPAANSNFGGAKGTVFLVDRKSKHVVWSIYDMPKGSGGQQLDRIASDIVSRLKKDLAKQ